MRNSKSQIVIIGSGNVAYHLAKAFLSRGFFVKQIFGRSKEKLSAISDEISVPYSVCTLEKADWYVIAVSDVAVSEVSAMIPYKDCLVSHTSGALPKEVLRGDFRKSCFYPLQTFSKTKSLVYKSIPFFVEAENALDLTFLKESAMILSGRVKEATHEQRKYIHLAAVFACNFVNHLFSNAKVIAESQGVPFEYLLPLIEETVEKIHYLSPKEAQTGPAVRNDIEVLKRHELLISDDMQKEIYMTLNRSIKKMYNL